MPSAESNLVGLLRLHCSDQFLEDLSKLVRRVYRLAHRLCASRFPEDLAQDFRPYIRWMMMEAELLKLAKAHGLTGSAEWNSAKSQRHVEVAAGPIILTASAVDEPSQVPRRALFRETLARSSEPWLFAEMAPDPPKLDAPLHALLIHAPRQNTEREGRFANIRFPLPDYKKYANGKIELFAMFPSAADAKRTFAEEEKIEDQVLAHLRDDAERNAGESKQA